MRFDNEKKIKINDEILKFLRQERKRKGEQRQKGKMKKKKVDEEEKREGNGLPHGFLFPYVVVPHFLKKKMDSICAVVDTTIKKVLFSNLK